MCKLMEDYTERKSRIAEQRGEITTKNKTACKMIAKGMDFAEIAELVGLSVEQVEQLAKENK